MGPDPHFGMNQKDGMLQVPPSQSPAVKWILFGVDSVPKSQIPVSDADGVPNYRKSPGGSHVTCTIGGRKDRFGGIPESVGIVPALVSVFFS